VRTFRFAKRIAEKLEELGFAVRVGVHKEKEDDKVYKVYEVSAHKHINYKYTIYANVSVYDDGAIYMEVGIAGFPEYRRYPRDLKELEKAVKELEEVVRGLESKKGKVEGVVEWLGKLGFEIRRGLSHTECYYGDGINGVRVVLVHGNKPYDAVIQIQLEVKGLNRIPEIAREAVELVREVKK